MDEHLKIIRSEIRVFRPAVAEVEAEVDVFE